MNREDEAVDILIARVMAHDRVTLLCDEFDPDSIDLGPELSDEEKSQLESLGTFQEAMAKCGYVSNAPRPPRRHTAVRQEFMAMNRDIGEEFDDETKRQIQEARRREASGAN